MLLDSTPSETHGEAALLQIWTRWGSIGEHSELESGAAPIYRTKPVQWPANAYKDLDNRGDHPSLTISHATAAINGEMGNSIESNGADPESPFTEPIDTLTNWEDFKCAEERWVYSQQIILRHPT